MKDIGDAVQEYEQSGQIGCIIMTGEGRAFAAGADIKQMASRSYYDVSTKDMIAPWEIISKCKVPIIAAVNGFAFGGGSVARGTACRTLKSGRDRLWAVQFNV